MISGGREATQLRSQQPGHNAAERDRARKAYESALQAPAGLRERARRNEPKDAHDQGEDFAFQRRLSWKAPVLRSTGGVT